MIAQASPSVSLIALQIVGGVAGLAAGLILVKVMSMRDETRRLKAERERLTAQIMDLQAIRFNPATIKQRMGGCCQSCGDVAELVAVNDNHATPLLICQACFRGECVSDEEFEEYRARVIEEMDP